MHSLSGRPAYDWMIVQGKNKNLTYKNKHTHIFIQYHSYTINKHKTFYKYWLIVWLVINATVVLLLRGGQCHEGIIDLRYQNWPTKSIKSIPAMCWIRTNNICDDRPRNAVARLVRSLGHWRPSLYKLDWIGELGKHWYLAVKVKLLCQ